MDTEKHEEHNADQPVYSQGAVSFSLPSARELLSELRSVQLDPDDARRKAIASSLAEYERQLNSIESLYRVQTSLATEFGLHGALAEGCADAVGNAVDLVADPHATAAAMPDVFSVTDDFMDREHVRALAYQAGCPQEAVRKELRAFQKTAADRVRLAAKRTKASGQEPLPAPAAGVRSTPSFRSASPAQAIPGAAGAASHRPPSKQSTPPPQQQQQQPTRTAHPIMDERLYCWDEAEEAARKAQLTKLGGLLNPDKGGICKEPISTVGVFQQQMPSYLDWRVRRLALEAMSRSSLDVLWRLMQNSKVLDSLHAWVQEALADQQITMMELMLETMACLPMPRYLLKGSRLEAALEGLAGGGRHGGGGGSAAAAAVDDGSPHAGMRRRFGDAAAAVLTEWRNDPDQATIMRRAGGVVPDAPVVAVARISVPPQAAAAAATAIPGSRLLGAAAAKDVMRKRALSISRAQGEARPAARPRAADAGGGNAAPAGGAGVGANGSGGGGGANGITAGSGGGGGLQSAPKRGSLASAAPPRPVKGAVDMTAKLGEKGPADPDVVAGFRSRFGDGSVRRSQLARPARAAVAATAPPTAATVREPSPGPAPPAAPAPAALGAAGAAAAHTPRQPGAAEAGSTGGDAVSELGPEGLARLRAERAVQRQATALLALQAEARRHPEVAAAEAELRERQRAKREALRVEEQRRWVAPEELRRRLQAMHETVPWRGPPPKFLVLPDETPAGTGEESTERLERAQERERVPKVSFPGPERIPDSPAEPATQQQHQQQPPPRPLPWAPLSDTEEGAIDWFRQNLGLWERGMRRAEFVLPPFLLHKHLELAPDLLPPLLAAPPPPPPPQPAATPAASAASVTLPGQPPSFGPPHLHPSQPQPHSHSHSQQAPPAATVMRQHMVSDAPPAAAAGAVAAAAGLVETDWRGPPPPQQHHRPQLAPLPPPPPLMPVVTTWERPAEPGQLLLSKPAPIVVLNVTSAPPPTYVVPLMTMPTAPPLQPQSQTQAQPHLQPPVQMSYSEGPYGHVNGPSAPAAVPAPGPWQQQPPMDERAPYGYAGNGELPPPHAKLGRPQQQPSYQQPQQYHHPPPSAYQQPEPAQSHHHRHDMHAPYVHRQNGHGADVGPGDYGSGQYPHQEQQRPAYHGGWQESRGYQQPWEYGGRG